jgi:methionyl-tRNA formyltransferase
MRLVFAGTPVFAERALARILSAGHEVVGVLTQPDRPAGRGPKLAPSPVKPGALAAGLPVLQPASLRGEGAAASLGELAALRPDVMVVAAYGLILPQAVLDIAPLGCLNIHASLLPRWRGAAPIVRAIQAGDTESGVCIMKMEAGLDTGPVALVARTPISPEDTGGSLHDRLAALGAEAIVRVLDRLADDPASVRYEPQPQQGVTYAHKIGKSEVVIDWREEARRVADHIRALDPQPGSRSATVGDPGTAIRFYSPVVMELPDTLRKEGAAPAPGTILAAASDGLVVACGRGAVRIAQLQRAGGRRLVAADFLRGHPMAAGEHFALPV